MNPLKNPPAPLNAKDTPLYQCPICDRVSIMRMTVDGPTFVHGKSQVCYVPIPAEIHLSRLPDFKEGGPIAFSIRLVGP